MMRTVAAVVTGRTVDARRLLRCASIFATWTLTAPFLAHGSLEMTWCASPARVYATATVATGPAETALALVVRCCLCSCGRTEAPGAAVLAANAAPRRCPVRSEFTDRALVAAPRSLVRLVKPSGADIALNLSLKLLILSRGAVNTGLLVCTVQQTRSPKSSAFTHAVTNSGALVPLRYGVARCGTAVACSTTGTWRTIASLVPSPPVVRVVGAALVESSPARQNGQRCWLR